MIVSTSVSRDDGEYRRAAPLASAKARGAQVQLGGRLLGAGVEHASAFGHVVLVRRRRGHAIAAAIWSTSVDLPIPGSPPRSTSEPGTSPPPSRRSTSAMPVGRRGSGRALESRQRLHLSSAVPGRLAERRMRARRRAWRPDRSTVSTSEFHAPQSRHWPSQRGKAAAQAWQTYALAWPARGTA